MTRDEAGAEFDAILAAHDADVRAGALLDAAAAMEAEDAREYPFNGLDDATAYLRARAAGTPGGES